MVAWWILHWGVGLAGTWLAMRYAIGRQLIDQPGMRRSHSTPTARGGGIAIVAAMLAGACWLGWREPDQRLLLAGFAAGLALVAGIGLLDDHRPLSPWARLATHALAAAIFALALGMQFSDPALGLAALVVMLALTNIWNFMDGIDGLAASQALITGAVLAGAAGTWGMLGAALCAACLGFLPWNFPRARIFLGDVGSGAIGFAVAALWAQAGAHGGPDALLLLLPLSAFLVDAGLTLFRRVLRGEQWWTAHTQHAYQVWARRIGHVRVTLAYAGWSALGAGTMWWLDGQSITFILCIGLAWYMFTAIFWCLLQGMGSTSSGDGMANRPESFRRGEG